MAHDDSFPTHWMRAVLPLAVLHTLSGGPTYGYAIATTLSDNGFGTVKGGTLYPLLGRLEKDELVSVEWREGESGPGRKYYTLTDAGRATLEDQRRQWDSFITTTQQHFSATPANA